MPPPHSRNLLNTTGTVLVGDEKIKVKVAHLVCLLAMAAPTNHNQKRITSRDATFLLF